MKDPWFVGLVGKNNFVGILSGFPAIQSNELLAIFAWILRIADSFEDSLQDFPEIVSTENEGKDLSIDWDDLEKKIHFRRSH